MKLRFLKRVLVLVLTFCMVLTMIPLSFSTHNDVEAISGVNSLTCANYISNSIARNYIDKMMRYYINNNSSLRNTLDNGLSVVFMFEGGSDNYWNGSDYTKSDYDVRNQAVCIVVKKDSSGNAKIVFVNESSCSIPGDPTWCTGASYSGSTTLMDGIYSFYTWNHTGPYAAFQCSLSSSNGCGYYTPPASPNGYQNGASGINIHTRSSNIAGGQSLGWVWSAGCQLISYGNDTGNEFNSFMKAVCGITWNSWINYSSKTFNTWASSNVGITKGYYVVDRQLGLMNSSGTKYGSGSLINLYNKTALTNITAKSTAAATAAGADKVDYVSQCTYYPSYGKVKITADDVWTRTLPCYSSVDSGAASISCYNTGDVLTVTGLYKNTVGEYWYRTTSPSGAVVYFNGAYADFTEKIISDIKMTDHNPPNGHVYGKGAPIDGNISSQYNRLTNVSAYVYKGFGVSGDSLTGTSVSISATSYKLEGSDVDSAVWMNVPETGPNTLQISVKYINYYVTGGTTLKSNTGTIVLATDYFMVVPTAVTQSSCSHTYQNYTSKAATCTSNGETVQACTTCGYIKGKTTVTASHSYGDWKVTKEATCTSEGTKMRTCSKCGNNETQSIPFGGHSYTSTSYEATCQDYKRIQYTCGLCGDTYSEYADSLINWTETAPSEEAGRNIETKTQYRYSDYTSFTSYNSSETGYTAEKSEWEKASSGTVNYVKSWPSGFNTSNSLYSTYNKTPKTAVTNTNDKTTIDSDNVVGYLYYHWCYTDSYYSTNTKKDDYTTFHAYYSTTAPGSYQCDTSDMSYCTKNTSCCSNSEWFFVTEVNQQKYTTYKKLYTHSKWSDWSDWSDNAYAASSTRKVETRTLYRSVKPSDLGNHIYADGICTICSKAEPDFYLFGYINGADYACEGDSENIGTYKFVDGKLTARFTENSYVAVKTSDNLEWYMADGYPGDSAREAVLYNTNKGINAEKLFVPKGIEVILTLVSNGDGSYTLSYDLSHCEHTNHNVNGFCTVCGVETEHTYENNVCTVCGKSAPVYYLFGFINGADYEDIGYRFVNGTLNTKFTEDTYVAVRTGDNSVWYMTDGYQENATSVTLYNVALLEGRGDKLFVPGGKNIAFALTENEDGTFTLSYTEAGCAHNNHDINGVCTACGVQVNHAFVDGECSVCSFVCGHAWGDDDVCTVCSKAKPVYYLFGYVNGEDYYGLDYKFEDGKLTAKFTDATYIAVRTGDDSNWYMTDGYQGDDATTVQLYNTKILDGRGDKIYIPRGREITFSLADNGDDSFTLSYTAADCEHEMHNLNGICISCGETVEHTLVDGNCTVCGNNCKHNWVDGYCTNCNRPEPVYYLCGFVNGADYEGEEYRFENGRIVTTFKYDSYIAVITDDRVRYMTDGYLGEDVTSAVLFNQTTIGDTADKLYIPGGHEVIISLVDNGNNTLTLNYTLGACKHFEHDTDGICKVCQSDVGHSFSKGYCTTCGKECTHRYQNLKCTVCGMKEPDYYLFGYINGANYACEEDAANLGIYRFRNGKLVAVFTQDSFVAVKTGDNLNWYMTNGYQGADADTVTMYNTKSGIEADKIFIPKGRLVTFTLVNNGDDTLTLSYEVAPCYHSTHNTEGICLTCGADVKHTYHNGMCTICAKVCDHKWVGGKCIYCEYSCSHIWIDGECSRCTFACNHDFIDGVCTICSHCCVHDFANSECHICGVVCQHNWIGGICYNCNLVCMHTYENSVCTNCNLRCKHEYVNGKCLICKVECTHKWHLGLCLVCDSPCVHSFQNGVCVLCKEVCTHNYENGKCIACGVKCTHSEWVDGSCNNCHYNCTHTWNDGVCTVCKMSCKHQFVGNTCTICSKTVKFYLVGNINNKTIGYEGDYINTGSYAFNNGMLSVKFEYDSYVCVKTADNKDWYMAKKTNESNSLYLYNVRKADASELMFIPAGVEAQFILIPDVNDTFKLTYFAKNCTHNTHNTKGKCVACSADVEHSFENDVCTQCNAVKPMEDMYLFGIINGKDYGYNADASTIGTYNFTDKQLTAKFTKDTYVAVKTADNMNWYMAENISADSKQAVMYNTRTGKGSELMFVPGGVEVRFTIGDNGNGAYILKYEITEKAAYSLTVKFADLKTDGDFRYAVNFTQSGLDSVNKSDMGLLILDSNVKTPDVSAAQQVISGVYAQGNYLVALTDAVNAENLVDTMYFAVFAKLADGTYVYSDIYSYDAVRYAKNVINNKLSSKEDKAYMVSLLNYISASQKYHNYKTDELANADLTAEQKSYVQEYSSGLGSKVNSCGREKAGEFAKQGTGAVVYPTGSLDASDFTLSYNLKVQKPADGEIKMYYWLEDDFKSAELLTCENATGVITMKLTDGVYVAQISDISLQDLFDTIYVSVVYTSADSLICSGVLSYSMAEYCKVSAENASDVQELAQAIVVYGYYLDKYLSK